MLKRTSLRKQRSINEMLKQQQKKHTTATKTKSPEQQSQSSIPKPVQNTQECLAVTDTGPNTSVVTMVNQTPLPSSETSITATEDTQKAHPIIHQLFHKAKEVQNQLNEQKKEMLLLHKLNAQKSLKKMKNQSTLIK